MKKSFRYSDGRLLIDHLPESSTDKFYVSTNGNHFVTAERTGAAWSNPSASSVDLLAIGDDSSVKWMVLPNIPRLEDAHGEEALAVAYFELTPNTDK